MYNIKIYFTASLGGSVALFVGESILSFLEISIILLYVCATLKFQI